VDADLRGRQRAANEAADLRARRRLRETLDAARTFDTTPVPGSARGETVPQRDDPALRRAAAEAGHALDHRRAGTPRRPRTDSGRRVRVLDEQQEAGVERRASAPAGYRFPREVIALAVRWYLRYGLSYRDVEELLAERGIEVDHVTVYRWVQTFTLEFIEAARPARHATGGRWFVDETYVKVAGGLDLSLPCGRSARSGHRCAGLDAPRLGGCTRILHPRAGVRTFAGRGDD
jgi:hypothetical protein